MKNADSTTSKRTRAALARGRVRARLPQLNFTPSTVMLGTPEIVGLSVAALLLVLAIISYFYALVPARERLATTQAAVRTERQRLQDSGSGLQQGNTQQATVTEIVDSLRQFEMNYLPSQSEGQITVVEELNEAIRRHNLRPKGLSFTPLESLASSGTRGSTTGTSNARLQSVFPALGLTVGVEGTYTDVRRFIYAVEASRQFIIINSVELEGVRDAGAGRGANTPVSLNLNMAAYFRPTSTAASDAPASDRAAAPSTTQPATR